MAKKQDIKIQELETKITELDSQLKRAVADYRNLEQRISQGRSELTNFVGGELIKRLLPVLDHLEQALAGVKESSESESQSGLALSERSESNGWVKGVELAVKEFKQVLQSEGLDEILADGVFDPSLHEAVDTQEVPPSLDSSGEPKENMILKVVRKGYNLNGKVLRPAQVVVGRSVIASEAKQSGSEEEEIAASPSAPRNDGAEGGENKNEMSN